jgi:hypothetical protein
MINSRIKGKTFELDIVNDLKSIYGARAKRHLEFQQEEAMGVDIDTNLPLLIQCKRGRNFKNPITVLDEIRVDEPLKYKLVIQKADREEPIAYMYWGDLLDILKVFWELSNR